MEITVIGTINKIIYATVAYEN